MDDFRKYATKHLGMNSLALDDVIKSQAGYLNPYILEERQLNVTHLKYIHILKANEAEMEVLTGCSEPHEAALLIADWGVKEVLLTLGDKGSLIYAQGEFHEIPAYPALQITDATGCGDTYMVGYLYMRNKGASHREAGCFAAAMCTIKLQSHGPFCGTEEAINNVIKG